MELRHLRYFVAVAEELHFGRAAGRLHIAQPPLSQQIQKLERELGVTLLSRTKRRVALTDAGAVFLVEARRILEGAREAVVLARRTAAGEMGRLRVGYVDWAVYLRLPEIVRTYRERHPDVDLGIEEMHVLVQREALARSDLDLGFFALPDGDPDLESESVVAEPLMVGLPEGHPLASTESVPLDALADEPWVLMQRALKTQLVELVLATCARAGFVPQVVQEAGQVNTVAALVSAGLGVTLLPRTVATLPREHFVARPLSGDAPTHHLHAVWKGELSPTGARFLAIARDVEKRRTDRPGAGLPR